MSSSTFSTETLDSTEKLALTVTREQYAAGDLDHDEFEDRVARIVGLHGEEERSRVLQTDEVVDVTCFGSPSQLVMATAWTWPAGGR